MFSESTVEWHVYRKIKNRDTKSISKIYLCSVYNKDTNIRFLHMSFQNIKKIFLHVMNFPKF